MSVEQVYFYHFADDKFYGGILVDNKYVICGCCGSVFELEDGEIEISVKLPWVDISGAISGD